MALLDNMFDLTGKAAVVTGGGSGIGEATSLVLAEAGAAIVVADINEDAAQATADQIVEQGGKAVALRTDVQLRADHDAAVDSAVAEFGSADIYCNIAGIPCDAPVSEISEVDLDRMIGINLKGVLFGCQAAMRVMKPQGTGGNIVNVSSTGIDVTALGNGIYGMTKAGVAMLSMFLATEAGPYGIRVNAIAPGATETAFSARHKYDADGNVDEAKWEQFLEGMRSAGPLHMVGEAIDQAMLILYLVSPAARFATGNIFRVNGGQSMAW
jgi:3-oxoacyl-[acyl-carrier protein] reductase